jgi:hypothetical protein
MTDQPSTAMTHVRYLAETIGPRGSTTPKEAEAAAYARQVLAGLGLQPATEPFASARSAWWPYALAAGLVLMGEVLFLGAGRGGAIVATLLTVAVIASMLLELTFRSNPLRWLLPKGQSQNVWAAIPAADQPKHRLVLMGHLDSHRTPLVFKTDAWVRFFARLVPLGLGSMLLSAVIFALGSFSDALAWRILSLVPTAVVLLLLALTLQADTTPYTAGANDNATGAGIVLSLAGRLRQTPLPHTEVWAVLTGCEEVGDYGAAAFAQRHRAELAAAGWIVLDTMGGLGAGPCYVRSETFLLPAKSDPELLRLADALAARRPDLKAYGTTFHGAYSELSIGVKEGLQSLGFIGLRPDGALPEWHRLTDTVANVDPDAVQRAETFVWELLREIDLRTPVG